MAASGTCWTVPTRWPRSWKWVAAALMVADIGSAWDQLREEQREDWRRITRAGLAAISERWELVERGQS